MKNSKKRFVTLETEVSFGARTELLVDTKTGVTYLWRVSGYAGGLTPLLNADGTPVITRVPPTED